MITRTHRLALVTAPNLKIARRLATGAVRNRLVACANLLPSIESRYWWQGKVESGSEVLIVFKTTQAKLGVLEDYIVAQHPYDTPEFIVLAITSGSAKYLGWIDQSVAPKEKHGR